MTVTINGNGTITPTSAIQPTGSILQIVSGFKDDSVSFSTLWTAREISSDLRAVITPTATSSKILVTCHLSVSQASNIACFQLTRTIGGTKTNIFEHTDSSTPYQGCANTWFEDDPYITYIGFSFLDSPNTTSEITYSPDLGGCGNTVYINKIYNSTSHLGTSSTIAMEVAG